MKNAIIILLILGLGAGAYFYKKNLPTASSQDLSIENRQKTAKVERQDIKFEVNVAGEIGPAEQVSVRPEVNGKIAEMPVDIGDQVKKGDLLFRLDDKDLQIEIASRDTEISSAKLQLEQSQREYERAAKLFQEKLISKEAYENSKTTYDLSLNSIQRAEKNMEMARDRLSRTRVVAPFDCTVLTRPVSVGQAVSGSGGFNSGTEVLTIADLASMVINAHVNQADITRLKVGMKVTVQVEAVPGLMVQGEVERIAPQATVKSNIKGFSARILLRNVDSRVQPGMTANLSIPVASSDNALAVPLSAVYTEQDGRYAYVLKGDQYERRTIQIGVADYFNAEVLSGLNEGEVVSLEQPPSDKVLNPPEKSGKGSERRPSS